MKTLRFFIFFFLLVPLYLLLSAAIYVKAGITAMSLFSMVGLMVTVIIVLRSMWPGWKEILGRRCPLCHERFFPPQCPIHGKIVLKSELP
jgi:hypothetical protein